MRSGREFVDSLDASVVMTNKSPPGPNRGYGCQQLYFETERMVDLLAERLGLDPAAVRMRNFIGRDEFPYRTPAGGLYDSGDYDAVLERALEVARYDELRREQARARGGQALRHLMDYLVPTAGEAPTIDIAHVVTASPFTTLGSKGLGESSCMTAPAVVANAVSDALGPLGLRVSELPLTPNRLWDLLRSATPERQPGRTTRSKPSA